MELPIYILDIDENDELSGVPTAGLVESPAHDKAWQTFNKDHVKQVFQVHNEELQILGGALMVADLPIIRIDKYGNPYYVVFPAKSIYKIVDKLKRIGKGLTFNINHKENEPLEAYLLYDFIISEKMGISTPKGFDPLPDGSWFGYVKVPEKKDFDYVKENLVGFSVEGYFNDILLKDEDTQIIEELINQLNNETN